MPVADVIAALSELAGPQLAIGVACFFQTGPGQCGEGDRFIGIKVPVLRNVVKRFPAMSLTEINVLLESHRSLGAGRPGCLPISSAPLTRQSRAAAAAHNSCNLTGDFASAG